MTGLEHAITGLQQALDTPSRHHMWRWLVRHRMAGVKEALALEHSRGGDAWLAARQSMLARERDRPGSFPVLLSIELLIGVVIAGLGSLWGIMAGALFLVYLRVGIQELADVGSLPDGLQDAAKSPGIPGVIYGIVLILVLFVLPRGAAGFLRKLSSPLTNRL